MFEDNLGRYLGDKYECLPESEQLSWLPIALRRGAGGDTVYVSLRDYLEDPGVPLDLPTATPDDYILLLPEALLHGIRHVRKDKIADPELWTSLARDLVTCVAVEAASEIARMYEYQIALLTGDAAIKTLANHAADCILAYVKHNKAYLDRNSAILGVVRGSPANMADSNPIYLSVILGSRELKWELGNVFKKPGLRRESLLWTTDEDLSCELDSGPVPWTFHTADHCQPREYGYRGLLTEWDWQRKFYRVHQDDTVRYQTEVEPGEPGDFHRSYNPYKRLIGLRMMLRYADMKEKGRTTLPLAEFVNQASGVGSRRDTIQPVYRPLAPPDVALNFGTCNLDNVDLARAQLRHADLSQASVRHSNLLLADAAGANLSGSDPRSADLSYATLSHASVPREQLENARLRHTAMEPAARREAGDQVDGGPGAGEGDTAVLVVSDSQGNLLDVEKGERAVTLWWWWGWRWD